MALSALVPKTVTPATDVAALLCALSKTTKKFR
jgi:hypothetical protein